MGRETCYRGTCEQDTKRSLQVYHVKNVLSGVSVEEKNPIQSYRADIHAYAWFTCAGLLLMHIMATVN
jgi:hypothetical protein